MAKTKTVAEVAGLLGVSKVAIQSRIKRGTLRGKKIDGRWRIPQSEVERLMTGVDNVADNAIEHGTNVLSNVAANVGAVLGSSGTAR